MDDEDDPLTSRGSSSTSQRIPPSQQQATGTYCFFMVAICNRADHYVFALLFLSSIFFFIPHLISAAADWMSSILAHMVWP